jgi:glycosyltransferase involved in cell wall biosynthesis
MSNRKDSLIILTPGFPASEEDTTCLPMQQQFVRSLNALYPRINVIILSFQYPYHTRTYKWFDTTVVCLNGQNKRGLSKLLLRKKINTTLKDIHNENHIVGLLSFWYGECAYIGKKFGEKYGIKHFCWLFGQDAKKENRYPRTIRPKSNELIALSDFLQDEFEKNHGIRPATVIPPGNDTTLTENSASIRNIDILGVGSLIRLKQYDIFIEVVDEIKKKFPLVKARLAGSGQETKNLQNLISKLKLDDHVILTGELAHDRVLQLMHRTKVLLHTSSYEGFSGVCLEALNAGSHVITFTKPMHHVIPQWHVVQSKNEMIEKLVEILQNPNISYERQVVFKMEDTVRKIMELYKLDSNSVFKLK